MTPEIVPVRTKQQREVFIRVPFDLYADDPSWVPPLLFDRRDQISPKHPFFRHADMQAFVAYDNGKAVGGFMLRVLKEKFPEEWEAGKYGERIQFKE